MDVLPADQVRPAHVVVAKRIQLVERVRRSVTRIRITAGIVVVDPARGGAPQVLHVLSHTGRGHARHQIAVAAVAELNGSFEIPQEAVFVAGPPRAQRC